MGRPSVTAERSDALGRRRAHAEPVGLTMPPATTTSCGRHESRNSGQEVAVANIGFSFPDEAREQF